MKERMQKMPTQSGSCPQQSRPEAEDAVGVQTFMRVVDGCLTTEQPNRYALLEQILSPANLNAAYKQVMRNKGAAGIDRMDCARLLGYLLEHKDALTESIRQRTYRPNPVRRVEIPKDNGKKRLLGIPTVVDRMIQQAIAQVLAPIYERQFSEGSFGFRPNRGAKQALVRVTEIVGDGYRYAVGIDLERFFDTVNHAKLIEILQRTIKDDAVISLIHRYLNAGVMVGTKVEATREGTPQGGPLSPLLANFIEGRLKLKVNREKTECAYIGKLKYLGYGFYVSRGKCRLRLHKKSEAKLRRKLKQITSRSNGMGYEQRKTALRNYLQGWAEYFDYADMGSKVAAIDQWLRRRLRMCIWKSWKKPRTRVKNLILCGIERRQAYQWGYTSKGYWRIADSWILARAIGDESLRRAGYSWIGCYYSASALPKG